MSHVNYINDMGYRRFATGDPHPPGRVQQDAGGMVSVAHVMKNRADSMAYGNQNGGLMEAIVAPNQFSM
jgi:hypothetical protein